MSIYKYIIVILLLSAKLFSQPINDNPCNAIPLNINTLCQQTTGIINSGTTSTPGIQAPSCGSYVTGDVWYSLVCPAAGNFTISTSYLSINDLAMAAYKGSCSSMTLTNCVYLGSGTGNDPVLSMTGVPGATYFIRVWSPSFTSTASVNGNFYICATATSTAPVIPTNADCLGAIPVCQSSYTSTVAYSGTGNIANEINSGTTCLGSGEKNDVWYQFTIQSSGQLCFAVDPINHTDDYDWILFNMTGLSCSDLYGATTATAACNYISQVGGSWGSTAGGPSWVLSSNWSSGLTGLFPTAPQSGYSQNSPCINVTTGQNFVLNISNFSATANGFHLYFPPSGTPGMAVLYGNTTPSLQVSQSTLPCGGGNQLLASFSENINCSSVSANDFTLTGPGGPYTISNQIGSACSGGGTSANSFLLEFSPAIRANGIYTLCLDSSLAGSVSDVCGNLAASSCFTFAVGMPTVTIVAPDTVCSGHLINLTASGATTYSWSTGATSYSITDTPMNTTIYPVLGIMNTCVSSASVSVAVTPGPPITVNSGSICAGQSFTITPSGTSSYTYTGGSNVVSPTHNTNYVVYGSNSIGGCVGTATSNVLVFSPTISVNSGTICSGNSFTLNPSGANTYTISGGSTFVSPTSNASFSVTGTDSNGCTSLIPVISNVTVNALPSITASSSNTLLCSGESATLTALGATSYTWSTSENTPTIVVAPTSNTVYSVSATDTNNCSNMAMVTLSVSTCTGVKSIASKDFEIVISPNPTNSILNISFSTMSQNTKIELYNSIGELVLTETISNKNNTINISDLSNGLYFMKVLEGSKVVALKKVVKE